MAITSIPIQGTRGVFSHLKDKGDYILKREMIVVTKLNSSLLLHMILKSDYYKL